MEAEEKKPDTKNDVKPALKNQPVEKPTFQFFAAGFGLNKNGKRSALQIVDVTKNIYRFDIKKGAISAIFRAELTSDLDIASWSFAERVKKSAKEMGSNEAIENLTTEELLMLSKYKLIRGSVMPGDSGGPLLFREKPKSPWYVVGVAVSVGAFGNFLADPADAKKTKFIVAPSITGGYPI